MPWDLLVVEKARLSHHQHVAEASDVIIEIHDLIMHLIGRSCKQDATLDRVIYDESSLRSRVAAPPHA